MAHVLLIDNSEAERTEIRSALRSDEWTVTAAGSPAAVTQSLAEAIPDLVVMNLNTAGHWEHQVLRELRDSQPELPIVLLTASRGGFAIAAWKTGTATYVPRPAAAKHLIATIQEIPAFPRCRRLDPRLQQLVACAVVRLHLPDNNLKLVRSIISTLLDMAEDFGVCDQSSRGRLAVSLDEALTNAVIHGNLDISSQCREQGGDAYTRLLLERQGQAPYAARSVTVTATYSREMAKFRIADQGRGFDHAHVMNPLLAQNLTKCHGRGVLLMRAFMDEVQYNEAGNCVTLTKRRSGRTPASATTPSFGELCQKA